MIIGQLYVTDKFSSKITYCNLFLNHFSFLSILRDLEAVEPGPFSFYMLSCDIRVKITLEYI